MLEYTKDCYLKLNNPIGTHPQGTKNPVKA